MGFYFKNHMLLILNLEMPLIS